MLSLNNLPVYPKPLAKTENQQPKEKYIDTFYKPNIAKQDNIIDKNFLNNYFSEVNKN
mgnify:CR=1 FL=1|tara:strand:+ start:413 stop:586 length:174 start_codon:yes stop_codon:yes gene_type:complete